MVLGDTESLYCYWQCPLGSLSVVSASSPWKGYYSSVTISEYFLGRDFEAWQAFCFSSYFPPHLPTRTSIWLLPAMIRVSSTTRLYPLGPPGPLPGTSGLETVIILQTGFWSVSTTLRKQEWGKGSSVESYDYVYLYCILCRLLHVEMSFHLKGIDLQTIRSRELPDCYIFQNKVSVFVVPSHLLL